ncbi:MAG: mannose-1-phosphate guanylyltransferase, partial [Acidobacteria bacterium]|nr:mannose-1-phosphate guanylyltransferase [Acidobacteriota bacterium]
FLALTGKDSLLQQTYRRIARLFPPSRIFVVGNAEHRALLRRQLPRVPPGRLLLEPVGRNTAAAIMLGAIHVQYDHLKRHGGWVPEPLLAVFPADHAIRAEPEFRRLVRVAFGVMSKHNVVVTLGVKPTHPHTGYGYIERGRKALVMQGQPVYLARRFTEKPDPRTAARFFRTQRYFWNSGIFFFRLFAFVRLLSDYLPATYRAYRQFDDCPLRSREFNRTVSRYYPSLPNISVDYALAEPAAADRELCVIPADMGWSDLGSWSAIYDWLTRGRGGSNLIRVPHLALEAKGNLVEARRKFVAALGVEGLIVVDTPEALLVCARERAQDVGKVVHYLEGRKWKRLL